MRAYAALPAAQLHRPRRERRTAPRFRRVADAAALVGLPTSTAYHLMQCGKLPVVVLPSPTRGASRRILRVPSVWIPRWLEMNERDAPRLTSEADVAQPGEPYYLTIRQCADALALARSTLEGLINADKFVPTVWAYDERRDQRVSRMRLDAWCWQRIREAEAEWYGLETPLTQEAVR